MKSKFLNGALLITSLLGYLEWGGGNASFLFQAEADIVRKSFNDPTSAFHPFVLIPMAGQLILFVTLFQKQPGRLLTSAGMGCIAMLLLFMFVIGLISLNYRILLSTVPFLTAFTLAIVHYRGGNVSGSKS